MIGEKIVPEGGRRMKGATGAALLMSAVSLLSSASWTADCPKQPKTTDGLIQSEQTWAHALETKDAAVLGCILADEFEDYSANGAVYKRSEVLEYLPQRKPSHNNLSELNPKLLGSDYGFVRGLNTPTAPDGSVVAHVRFTDIFAYRDGRWVALGGQETLVGK
jgi:hypothetical protein